MSNPQNNQSAQLFDIVQREGDGMFVVWTRKSLVDLGMVDRADVETAREGAFTDEGWADYLRQPHLADPTVWVIVGVYPTRPTVETVLTLLGVKRKPRVGMASPSKPGTARRPRPVADVAA